MLPKTKKTLKVYGNNRVDIHIDVFTMVRNDSPIEDTRKTIKTMVGIRRTVATNRVTKLLKVDVVSFRALLLLL